MFNKELILEKINLISEDLIRLEELSDYTIEELAADYFKYAALKNIMMEIIGRAIDINKHLICEAEQLLEAPKTYRETFLLLPELNILPQTFAVSIAGSAGFRNAIVHEYSNLDKNAFFETIGDAVKLFSQYCKYLMAYLDNHENKTISFT